VVVAILAAGRQPEFCDVDARTGAVPLSEWRRAREAGASAAVVVHLYGNPVDTAGVREIFSSGLLIDDAAQALGARTPRHLAGLGGDVGLFSFGRTKHIEAGGAALACFDTSLAEACRRCLDLMEPTSRADHDERQTRFRRGFDAARAHLRESGDPSQFAGLLDGLEPTLRVPPPDGWQQRVSDALPEFPATLEERRLKAEAWARGLGAVGFEPVGMDEAAAPWRYTCRLPGLDWSAQHAIGTAIRRGGVDVSHWYLPAHWYLGPHQEGFEGTLQLSREVFQFWIDQTISVSDIREGSGLVAAAVEQTWPERR
jgi:hypothetical protein